MIRWLWNKSIVSGLNRIVLILLLSIPMTALADAGRDYNIDQLKGDLKGLITFRDKFYGAAVVGKQAWMVGYYGTILHFDGEASHFERQLSGTNLPLFDINFLDEKVGYIIGKRGIVLKTRDGGKNWEEIRKEGEHNLFGLHFINPEEGWAVGDFGTIIHTTDGGETWEDQSLDHADINFNSCFFLNALTGCIVGEFEGIFHTRDGGATWQPASDQNMDGVSLFNVKFKNDSEGLAVGQNGVLFRTHDGGLTWHREKIDTQDNLLAIGVIGKKFSIVGLRGIMVEEAAGGQMDVNTNFRISDWLNCIAGLPAGAAIAAGDHGRILWSKGSNSPRTWEVLH